MICQMIDDRIYLLANENKLLSQLCLREDHRDLRIKWMHEFSETVPVKHSKLNTELVSHKTQLISPLSDLFDAYFNNPPR